MWWWLALPGHALVATVGVVNADGSVWLMRVGGHLTYSGSSGGHMVVAATTADHLKGSIMGISQGRGESFCKSLTWIIE